MDVCISNSLRKTKMKMHKRCLKSSQYASQCVHSIRLSMRERQILLFMNGHDNYKLSDIREAIWPGLFERQRKSLLHFEMYRNASPARIDALARHSASGYGSSIFAKMVRKGLIAYDTSWRWHITELGAGALVVHDLVTLCSTEDKASYL